MSGAALEMALKAGDAASVERLLASAPAVAGCGAAKLASDVVGGYIPLYHACEAKCAASVEVRRRDMMMVSKNASRRPPAPFSPGDVYLALYCRGAALKPTTHLPPHTARNLGNDWRRASRPAPSFCSRRRYRCAEERCFHGVDRPPPPPDPRLAGKYAHPETPRL